eukprot:13167267-Alexandrium_andersonii.AAC.1
MSFRNNRPGCVSGVGVCAVSVWSAALYADVGRLMLVCSATSRVSSFRAQITWEARRGRGSVPESILGSSAGSA